MIVRYIRRNEDDDCAICTINSVLGMPNHLMRKNM